MTPRDRWRGVRPLLVAITAVSLTACGTTPAVATPPDTLRMVGYTTPPKFTGTWPTTCTVHNEHPDPACTPGSVGTTDQTEVCVPGFSPAHRPHTGTAQFKTLAMRAYHIPAGQRATTELDHLVPMALGGSNDATNLWPMPSDLPGQGFRNSKDNIVAKLKNAVCRNKVKLGDAQHAMAHDWTTALNTLGVAA